ncbi:MAG: UDP-N-acetylmuramate--L-alanine ligase [Gammaproteobacteria bacterium]|nr:UDP-N-acetylmuramate--L-alanine ligase [Gammaproteobacteria bacterium]
MITDHAHLTPFMQRVHKVHFVGIGGVGMSGIAEVMNTIGYEVSGSDLTTGPVTEKLIAAGIKVYTGHAAQNVRDVDVVVTSSAVSPENPEIKVARTRLIPVVPRAEMLAELMRFSNGIAVAGTHGKTTTTSLIASILAEGNLDPTYVIGGKLNSSASNAKLGSGQYLVAEADESDASFLYLQPMLAVITNVDADHLSTYDGDFDRLRDAFVEFLHHLPFYGLAVVCVDDDNARRLLPQITRPIIRYGIKQDADICASNISTSGLQSTFDVMLPGSDTPLNITLNLPGRHNILNALAAIAVAFELGVDSRAIKTALKNFAGIGRRMQIYGDINIPAGVITMVDDYGHHPTEVAATLEAVRSSWPERRLVVVFQPHRYSRTLDLFDDFSAVLADIDVLLICKVYAAGEKPIKGANARALCAAIRQRGKVNPILVKDVDEVEKELISVLVDGDVLLTLGAGSIGRVATKLPRKLQEAA